LYGIAASSVDNRDIVTAILRQGSADARGRLLFVDTFANGLSGWEAVHAGDAKDPEVRVDVVELPPASAYFDAGTVGGGGSGVLQRSLVIGDVTRVGVELGVRTGQIPPDYTLQVTTEGIDVKYTGAILVSVAGSNIQLLTPTGYELIVNPAPVGFDTAWMIVKLVVDQTTGKYVRAVVGQLEINLEAYDMQTLIVPGNGRVSVDVKCAATNGTSLPGIIGHVFVTVDEP
jgi:hypothetical protein